MYISNNYGEDWTKRDTSAPVSAWYSVAMSSNGLIQTAVVNGGFIYKSTNAGNEWTQITDTFNNWTSVAMSSDGSIQMAT